jgi:hypothetical protein
MLKFIFLFLSFSFSLEAAIPKTDFPQSSRFADYEKGYIFQFPEHWQVQRSFMGLDAFAAAPANKTESRSEANISVQAYPLQEGMTLNEFYLANITPLPAGLNNFKIIETGKAAFNGFEGKMAIYNHTAQNGLKFRVRQYFIVNGQMGYIITGSCIANEFDKYMPIFEQSAKTLRFL